MSDFQSLSPSCDIECCLRAPHVPCLCVLVPPLDLLVSLTLRGADWSGWARAKRNKATAWKERCITRREKTGGIKNKRETVKKESFYHADVFEGTYFEFTGHRLTKPDKTWIGWGSEPPSVSLSLLMSPPLPKQLQQPFGKDQSNGASACLHMTSAPARSDADLSVCAVRHVLIREPHLELFCFHHHSAGCSFHFFFLFYFLHVKRRACRTWLRQVDLIWVWPAQLELLVISDNRGAVPAWPGSDSIAALESALVDLYMLAG